MTADRSVIRTSLLTYFVLNFMFGCALSIAGLYTTLAEWPSYENELLSKVSTGLPMVFLISSLIMWFALYVKIKVS